MYGINQVQRIDPKNIPKRIEWKIVIRIISFLHYNSGSKKTNIAMGCHLGYKRCAEYLNWLETLVLIQKDMNEDGSQLISLNERGIEIAEKFPN